MILIIGLGNPGDEYKDTRHNAGYMVIDAFKVRPSKLSSYKGLTLLKSQNFMNDSGIFVVNSIKNYKLKIKNLIIIHDDLDIPLGKYKIQFGKGPKAHNGLKDIYEKLSTKDFWHVRVGIENRNKELENRVKGEDYVLENFTKEEKDTLDATIKRLLIDLVGLISKQV